MKKTHLTMSKSGFKAVPKKRKRRNVSNIHNQKKKEIHEKK
jgi:hypothetical protein